MDHSEQDLHLAGPGNRPRCHVPAPLRPLTVESNAAGTERVRELGAPEGSLCGGRMSVRGISAVVVALFAVALPGTAQEQAQRQTASVDELAGLWKAQRLFGPLARGTLVIRRSGSSYTADMLGRTLPVRVDRGIVFFELPNDPGKFRGRLQDDGSIFGFWFPANSPTGMVRTSPVTLRTAGPNRWVGRVEPAEEDTFTFYLLARKRPDGSMGAFLPTQECAIGALWRVEGLAREGNAVKLIRKPSGQPAEDEVATGTYNPEDSVLALDLPQRD